MEETSQPPKAVTPEPSASTAGTSSPVKDEQQQDEAARRPTLTELAKDEEDKDMAAQDGQGQNGNGQDGREGDEGGDDDEDEEEEDEEDEEEAQSDSERPRKRKRRRRGGNQFLDIEADVDEDEDEEEEEGEEGFIQNDDFIVRGPERADRDGGLRAILAEEGDLGDLNTGRDDEMHRRLDRKERERKDREAAEIARRFEERYRRTRVETEGADEWAPKALLMPSVNDPSIWGVKCKTGKERDLILSISRKAAALAASDNAAPLQIISAFHRDSIKGYIYVEARSESHVRAAVAGLIGVYMNTPNGVFLVDIDEMPDLLKTKQKKAELQQGMWVRIKRGKYAGDLAQILDIADNGEDILVKFVPRIDLAPKDESGSTDGTKKRKKGASAPLAFRPPQRLFNPDEIGKVFGKGEVQRKNDGTFIFKNEVFNAEGFMEKEIKLTGLSVDDIQPTIDELTRFAGDVDANGENANGIDFAAIADSARKAAQTGLQPGDSVEITEGDQKGLFGTVESITNDIVTIAPNEVFDLGEQKIEMQTRSVRKRFKEGDHIKVMAGSNLDETGLVVKVDEDVVTFLSDLSLQEVKVFSKDVREAAEVGSGTNTAGSYELHDLVQLDAQTAGVVFKVERDSLRVVDQTGSARTLKPSQIAMKLSSRNAVAIDSENAEIKLDEEMIENGQFGREGRKGRVLQIYRSMFVFLHNRDIQENGGVFVALARNLASTAPKGVAKAKMGQGLNPDLFGHPGSMPPPAAVPQRRDGRVNRRVMVTRGQYKSYTGLIKEVNGTKARVELHTNSKIVNVELQSLKEQRDDGVLIPLLERPYSISGTNQGDRSFSRDSSIASDRASVGSSRYGAARPNPGGQTVYGAPAGGQTVYGGVGGGGQTVYGGGGGGGQTTYGGRTGPYMGGRTPAYQSGRTPLHGGFGAGNSTPSYGATSAFNPSSRTPAYGGRSSDDPFNASSKTPYVGNRYSDYSGGKTPLRASGGMTPAYGAARNDSTNSNGDHYSSAPTPGMSHGYSAPTPAAGAPTPYTGAPTPAASAPTPGNTGAPTPYSAPTPGANGAPTPYTAPTPGASYGGRGSGADLSAPTPASGGMSSFGGGDARRNGPSLSRPEDWPEPSLRVRYEGKEGIVVSTDLGDNSYTLQLEAGGGLVRAVKASLLEPVEPSQNGQAMILAGEYRGMRATANMRDGREWHCSVEGGQMGVYDQSILCAMAS